MPTTEITTSATGLPVGTWKLDPTHSSAHFAVKHMVVATFRGRFDRFDAELTVAEDRAELRGTVDATSIVVKDENLQGTSAPRTSSMSSAIPRSASSPARSAGTATSSPSTAS